MLAFACRVGEGLVGAVPLTTLGLVWLATNAGPTAPDAASAQGLAALLLKVGDWQTITAALLFAVGSTIFSFLLLRGRIIPAPIAWLGVVGSALPVITLTIQLTGGLLGPLTNLAWLPVAVFELTVAFWLIIKGAAAPAARSRSV